MLTMLTNLSTLTAGQGVLRRRTETQPPTLPPPSTNPNPNQAPDICMIELTLTLTLTTDPNPDQAPDICMIELGGTIGDTESI